MTSCNRRWARLECGHDERAVLGCQFAR
jgi:hypothetical protein